LEVRSDEVDVVRRNPGSIQERDGRLEVGRTLGLYDEVWVPISTRLQQKRRSGSEEVTSGDHVNRISAFENLAIVSLVTDCSIAKLVN
jgi:hypothetical protein